MWGRKRRSVREHESRAVAADTGQAQAIRAATVEEKRELEQQRIEIESNARKLSRRREQNHFGEQLTLTFRPRGGRA